ncbi:unnamed protein product [Periconia digitata]|uniref:Endonuclease/exonuclease/phosphatase domain-containing protein n=1 Tax=Periconia digitata TaxID=1303443 RepID=A0A9W4UCQ5_9PLEO|nr:unnamed protein product [Periconia digitata]
MRFFSTLLPLLTTLAAVVAAAPDGTLSFTDGSKMTFKYKTSTANDKNWIGIYHTTGGPDDEKQVDPSLRWAYAPKADGSIELDVPVRASGQYKAYFLADDGYKHLAKPITFTPKSGNQDKPNEVQIMSYNLWYGGSKVNDYHNKQVKFIADSGADIIGLQEASQGAAKRLGEALGWNYHHPDPEDTSAILSRHPIVKRHPKPMTRATGVTIHVNGTSDQAINFFSTHTTAYPYGPYEFCFEGKDNAAVLETEKTRADEISSVLSATSPLRSAADKSPFVLVGDFNAPSHLDYTPATSSSHCGAVFTWPTSKLCTDAGLVDSFREAHPDPAATPGNTWSPVEKHNEDEGKDEPQDRIDFVYHKGGLKVLRSETLVKGTPRPAPDYEDNEWTSDHAALMTWYVFN